MKALFGFAVIILAGLVLFGVIGFICFLLFVTAEGYLDPGEEDIEDNTTSNTNNNINKR